MGQDQENRPGAGPASLAGVVGDRGVEDAHDRRISPGNLRKPASSFSPGMLPGSWANPESRVLGLMWPG